MREVNPASQMRTVRSSLAETRKVPQGLNATCADVLMVAAECHHFAPRRRVPQFERRIPAAGGEPCAVGTVRHRPDEAAVPGQFQQTAAAAGIPHQRRSVVADPDHSPTVGAERGGQQAPASPQRIAHMVGFDVDPWSTGRQIVRLQLAVQVMKERQRHLPAVGGEGDTGRGLVDRVERISRTAVKDEHGLSRGVSQLISRRVAAKGVDLFGTR
jgi:hypothetical protein